MATDGPTPPPCKTDIFRNGKNLCVVDGASNAVEQWVKAIAKNANTRVDWHYSGGQANVLHLGDDASRQRALEAVKELAPQLDGQILTIDGVRRKETDTVQKRTSDHIPSSAK